MTDKDYYDELFSQSLPRLLANGLAYLVAAVLILSLASCGTEFIPIESVHEVYHHTTDTIRQTDSIIRETNTVIREADSALVASLGIQLKANERAILILQKELERVRSEKSEAIHDTITKSDTIRVPYPVEGRVPAWEKVKLFSLGVTGTLFTAAVIGVIIWIRRRYRRK